MTVAHLQPPGAVPRFDAHHRLCGLPGGEAFFRRLDAVIQGVTQKMPKWRFKPFENVAIDLGILTDNVQPQLFAQRAGEISHHAREGLHAVGKRPHVAGQRAIVEPMREMCGAPVERVDLHQSLRQELLAFERAPLCLGQRRLCLFAQALRRQLLAQPIQRTQQVVLKML